MILNFVSKLARIQVSGTKGNLYFDYEPLPGACEDTQIAQERFQELKEKFPSISITHSPTGFTLSISKQVSQYNTLSIGNIFYITEHMTDAFIPDGKVKERKVSVEERLAKIEETQRDLSIRVDAVLGMVKQYFERH